MSTKLSKTPAADVEPTEVRQVLETILTSKYFVNAHKKKGFLRLICDLYLEGRANEVNEYRIAFDVFGRDKSYNPSADPIVRVVAHEIRKKLELYYQNEGAQDEIWLEIPAGSYQPIFTRHPAAPPEEIEETSQPPVSIEDSVPPHGETVLAAAGSPERRRVALGALASGVAVLVLAIAVVALSISNRELRQRVADATSPRDAQLQGLFWTPFGKDATTPLVVLSNPPTLRIANASDPGVTDKDTIPIAPETAEALKDKLVLNPEIVVRESKSQAPAGTHSPDDQRVVKQNTAPRLVYATNLYTGMGEAIGLHHLTSFFRTANRDILVKQSRTLSAEDLKNHNVILLGGVWVNEWVGKLGEEDDFVFTSQGTIVNRSVQQGEEREYIPQFDGRTGNLLVDYALITVKPNLTDANEVVVLAGVYSQGTEAAAEYITNRSYLDTLNQRLEALRGADGSAGYFQVLLKVGVENGIPTTVSILTVHKLEHQRS